MKSKSVLRFGLPKGSLQEATIEKMARAGYNIQVSSRSYLPYVDDEEMESYFSRRALIAGVLSGAVALLGLMALHAEARYVFDRLIVEGLPLVIVSILCGFGVLGLLLGRGRRGLRPFAAGAVVAVIWGCGVAQFPYLLPTSLKIDQAAAPGPTLDAVLVVFVIAAIVVLPALGLLYWLSQRELLGE